MLRAGVNAVRKQYLLRTPASKVVLPAVVPYYVLVAGEFTKCTIDDAVMKAMFDCRMAIRYGTLWCPDT